MKIEKLDNHMYDLIVSTLKNYVKARYRNQEELDVENLVIRRIRFIKHWGLRNAPEDGFILEFTSPLGRHKDLLGRSELGRSAEEIKASLDKQQQDGLLFGKSFTTNQDWFEYPVVWGELDSTFDDTRQYTAGGKYESAEYLGFERNDH